MTKEQRVLSEKLYNAVALGNYEYVNDALQAGANPNHKSGDYLPLILSAAKGYQDIIKLLIEYGANIEAVDNDDYCRTSLMLASRLGRSAATEVLLKAGADKEARDLHGDTALIHAADNGAMRTVRLLLMYGADATARGSSGMNALDCADKDNHYEIVEILKMALEQQTMDRLIDVKAESTNGLQF